MHSALPLSPPQPTVKVLRSRQFLHFPPTCQIHLLKRLYRGTSGFDSLPDLSSSQNQQAMDAAMVRVAHVTHHGPAVAVVELLKLARLHPTTKDLMIAVIDSRAAWNLSSLHWKTS
jgi:hypothetical protein